MMQWAEGALKQNGVPTRIILRDRQHCLDPNSISNKFFEAESDTITLPTRSHGPAQRPNDACIRISLDETKTPTQCMYVQTDFVMNLASFKVMRSRLRLPPILQNSCLLCPPLHECQYHSGIGILRRFLWVDRDVPSNRLLLLGRLRPPSSFLARVFEVADEQVRWRDNVESWYVDSQYLGNSGCP